MYDRPMHYLLLTWLILGGLIGAALFVAWEQALIQRLLAVDRSGLSWVIALIYGLVTAHCLLRVITVSTEHKTTQQVAKLFHDGDGISLRSSGGTVLFLNGTPLPQCVLTEYVQNLHIARGDGDAEDERDTSDHALLGVYESKLKGPQEIGWFVADMMLKLGLLGTIIGFIFMLGSVSTIADFDVSTMQKILQHMSSGMGTALYTTLTGLVCSVLASLQYHMLDKHCDEILVMIRHLSQTYINPKLIETT